MDTMDLKTGLATLAAQLSKLEDAARELPNQNFADIIKRARAQLIQAGEHPDIDAVAERLAQRPDEKQDGGDAQKV